MPAIDTFEYYSPNPCFDLSTKLQLSAICIAKITPSEMIFE